MSSRLFIALAVCSLSLPLHVDAQAPPERAEPVWIGDSDARVRLGLAIQLQAQATASEDMTLDVRVRRVRPSVRASLFDGAVTAALQLEAVPASAELIDAWIEAVPLPWLRLRAGQMKTPFTLYFQRSLTELPVDWALTSHWFGGERQLGLMAHGREESSGFGYAAGVFGGQNQRASFAREIARLYGAPLESPSRLVDPAPLEPMHPELSARIAQQGDGLFAHEVALSVAWDSGPRLQRDYALRVAPELRLAGSRWTAHAILFAGWLETPSRALELSNVGVFVELGWRAHRHLEVVARYARVHLLPYLVEDARQQRPDGVDVPHAQHELAIAFNGLIVGRSLAFQTDLAWLRRESARGAEDDLRLRVQLQVAF